MKRVMIMLAAGESDHLHGISVPVEMIAAAGDAKLPRAKILAYTGGEMNLSAMYHPVVFSLAGMVAAASIPLLRQHDPGRIVGHADKVDITASNVTVEGPISATGPDAQEVISSSANKFPWKASVGVDPLRVEFLAAGKTAKVNGRDFTGPLNIVHASRLVEVSFVPIGADSNTSANVAASRKEISMGFEEWLKANGFDKSALSESRLAVLKAAFDAKADAAEVGLLKAAWSTPVKGADPAATIVAGGTTSKDETAVAIQAHRTAMGAETVRVGKIHTLCAGKHAELEAKAIVEGWTAEKVELEVIRAERPKAPAGFVPDNSITSKIVEAAVCTAGGLGNAEKMYDAPTLEAAHKHFRGRIGLQELLLHAAGRNGFIGRSFRGYEADILRAAFSTADIAGILSNVANKFLLEGWSMVEDTWKQIAAIRPVNDFKQITSYRLTGDQEYEVVAPDGELKHGQLANESFTNQAQTYGKMLAITRQDQINDDLGALTAVPKMLGRGGALKFNTVFWTAFLNSAAFFTAGHGNLQVGTPSTLLSIDSLTAAELLFLNQTDTDGKPLGLAPEILLTPNALSTKATSLTRDTEIRDTTASTKYTTSNPHAGKWKPVRSSYLSNANISGYSALAWYLLANPLSLATIEACFLNGQQNPTIETANADFNVLGIQMRGYHDFGVSLQEYRAGVKSKGEA
jgi:phage major head subunit gpT-like protein